jgi:predicted dehydrogenase
MSIRLAFLGSGLATRIHSKTLRAIAPHVERWYASRDSSRAEQAAREFGGTGHLAGYEVAVDRQDIDAVAICLPPSLHREWTLKALAAGKHVIVEKPPYLTTAELDEVALAAGAAGRQVMVAENYFYKPLTRLLRQVVTDHAVGRLIVIQLNALKTQPTSGWRDDGGLAGGGALFEGGIHWVSLLASIGLTPARIHAIFPTGAGAADGTAVERSAVVTMEYAEGGAATLAYSWEVPSLVNGVRMSRMVGSAGILRFETNGLFATLLGAKGPRFFVPGLTDLAGYRAMMADFLAAIEQRRAPKYHLALARRDLALVERAYASAVAP